MLEKIVRSVLKTKDQKIEDFQNIKPVLKMINGGPNNVLQAVLQCLAGLKEFVKFFLNEEHLEQNKGTAAEKPMSNIISQVFESLYRTDLNISDKHIDTGFVAHFMKDYFPLDEKHCAMEVLEHIIMNII